MPPRHPAPPSSAAPLPGASRRALSALLAVWVLMLACAVQSPSAHAWLHVAQRDNCVYPEHSAHATSSDNSAAHAATTAGLDSDAGCPVTLFAQGLTLPLVAPGLRAPELLPEPAPLLRADRPALPAPARLHPPAHAPPARV